MRGITRDILPSAACFVQKKAVNTHNIGGYLIQLVVYLSNQRLATASGCSAGYHPQPGSILFCQVDGQFGPIP